MNLESYIRKYGYRPDYSTNDPYKTKYEKALLQYLGEERYFQFNEIRDTPKVDESIIMEFIGDDVNLLKLILSSQIKISLRYLEEIITIINFKKLKPNNILDLGGGDGWASDYLNETFKWNADVTIVDKYESWSAINPKSKLVNCEYSDFKQNQKYDLIISILGINLLYVEQLLKCIYENLDEYGTCILGLRIGDAIKFQEFVQLIGDLGFELEITNSYIIEALGEQMPIITLKKSTNKYSKNDFWRITRMSFDEILEPKRFYGIDGAMIYDLIHDGEELSNDRKDWENGDYFQIRVLRKNEINYRVITNSYGDILVETPILENDELNKVQATSERFSSNPKLWNSSL
jgi:hypothetical protein